jgi:hypothetical protein
VSRELPVTIGPHATEPATEPIERIWEACYGEFRRNIISAGIFSCRRINGQPAPAPWSEHAWANAWDIVPTTTGGGFSKAVGDRIYRFLKNGPPKRWVGDELLWQTSNHYDHIHVSGRMRTSGTPPCASSRPTDPGEQDGGQITHASEYPRPHQTLGEVVVAGESSARQVRVEANTWADLARQLAPLVRIFREIGRG